MTPLRTLTRTVYRLSVEWDRTVKSGVYARHDDLKAALSELDHYQRTDPPTRWRIVRVREVRAVLMEDGTGWCDEDEDNPTANQGGTT